MITDKSTAKEITNSDAFNVLTYILKAENLYKIYEENMSFAEQDKYWASVLNVIKDFIDGSRKKYYERMYLSNNN